MVNCLSSFETFVSRISLISLIMFHDTITDYSLMKLLYVWNLMLAYMHIVMHSILPLKLGVTEVISETTLVVSRARYASVARAWCA